MPKLPKQICAKMGCFELVEGRYCSKHQKEMDDKKNDRIRKDSMSVKWYNSSRWRAARELYLKVHPLCTHCLNDGDYTPANVIDHIKPHKGDYAKFWDTSNWQSLCKRCHDSKTAKEDGGFGNRIL